jgi:hypothetical protein
VSARPSLSFKENISRSLASTISLPAPFSFVSPRGRTPSNDRSSRSGGPPHRSRSCSPIRARSRSPPPRCRSPSLRSSSSSSPRGAGAARPLSHHEIMSGTAGVEDATAVAHRHAEDVSAPCRHLGATLPLEAPPPTLVADAVQAHVAPEKAVHCPASGRRLLPVGNGASGICI